MKVDKARFLNKKGNQLSARITLPDSDKLLHFAIIAHCFTCNKNYNSVRNISKALTTAGFGAFSFDYTGLGSSGGDFSETNFSTNVEDLLSAASYLAEKYIAPELLVGHSFGGPAAIYAAAKIPSVKAVATIAAPSEIEHITHLLKKEIDIIKEEGEATVNIGGNSITIEKQFLHDIANHNLAEVVRGLKKPILIMHSPFDSTVEIRHAELLYKEAQHPKSFISLDNADHLLNNKKDACYAGDVIAAWVGRYVTPKL